MTFECSKEDILAVRPGPSKVEFTGKQVGTVVITATLDGQEEKAFVKVKRMVEKEEDEAEPVEAPLIRDLPDSFYFAFETPENPDLLGTSYMVFTGDSFSYFSPQRTGTTICRR